MAGGRPKGAIVSQLKLPPTLGLAKASDAIETAHSKMSVTKPSKPDGLPDDLSNIWDEIVDALDVAGLISAVDGLALELALRHFLAAVNASDELIMGGSTQYDDKNERTMKNPASQVFRDHSTAFLEFAKQLGLSFVSRARVTISKGDAEDDGNPFAVNG